MNIPTRALIKPGQRARIPTGISIALPAGYEAQVRPRSGLAAKHGLDVVGAPGTVDSDYRGEISAVLINHGDSDFSVLPGMRIAQLVVGPVVRVVWNVVSILPQTDRGTGGFGSTGV